MTYPLAFTRHADGKRIYAAHVNELQAALAELTGVAFFATKRQAQWCARPGTTTVDVFGAQSPTTEGTASSSDDADGALISYDTTAAANGRASWLLAPTVVRRDWEPDFAAYLKTGASLANVRLWVGLFSGTPQGSATPALHYAGFRYDTVADSTAFWRCCTDDGGAAPTKTDTTMAIATATAYRLRIKQEANQVTFWINNERVAVHTTDLPTLTTGLGMYVMLVTLEAVAKQLEIGRVGWGSKG